MQVVVVEMSSPPLLMVEYPKVPGFENSDPQHDYSSCPSASKLPIRDPVDGSARLDIWVLPTKSVPDLTHLFLNDNVDSTPNW